VNYGHVAPLDRNRKELATKYCYRQAEMGVGDCGGLRYIPGATKSGKQVTPGWLYNLLGVEEKQGESSAPPDEKEATSRPFFAAEEEAAPEAGIGDGGASIE
jgi:hypothetical protein